MSKLNRSKKRIEDKSEAQKFQKEFYNKGFKYDKKCPFGEGILQELHWEKRVRIAKKFVLPNNRVLDFGCGDGTVTKALADSVSEVIGIDISEECIKRANKINSHPKVDYLNVPIEDFDAKERFDVVMMFEVIEHIFDPQTVIKQIYSILKKNGVLIISTPNFSNITRRMKKVVNPIVKKSGYQGWNEIASEHICEYSFKDMISIIKKCNFEIIKKDGVILAFPFTQISKKLIRNKLFHRANFYSGSLIPSLAIEMYFVARKRMN